MLPSRLCLSFKVSSWLIVNIHLKLHLEKGLLPHSHIKIAMFLVFCYRERAYFSPRQNRNASYVGTFQSKSGVKIQNQISLSSLMFFDVQQPVVEQDIAIGFGYSHDTTTDNR